MITVNLSGLDWAIISGVAWKRHDKYANTRSNYGTTRTIEKDLIGAAGEYAVHKQLGLEWTGMDDDMASDFEGIEVRTRLGDRGRLCLTDKEFERKNIISLKYVLCRWLDDEQTIVIVGWAWATELVSRGEHFDGRYYLPNDLLHDIETILL